MAKKQALKKPTVTELMMEIQSLKRKLNVKDETKKEKEKLVPTNKFSLEIVDPKTGEPFYTLRGLTASELHWWRRDLYKILVRGMGKKVSMSKVPEFKKVGAK